MRIITESFGDWLKQNLNTDLKDFSEIGDFELANTNFTNSSQNTTTPYKVPTTFKVYSNKDGTVYKLTDAGYPDKSDPEKADFPHSGVSKHAGKTYTLTKDQFEKLAMFRSMPQAPPG